MNFILYLLFISLFSLDWLSLKLHLIPRVLTWMPEILAVVIMIDVSIRFSIDKKWRLPGKYAVFLILYLCFFFGNILINSVSAGVVVTGIRIHLKFLPFFLLPLFHEFTETQIKQQLKMLLFLTIIQFPVALYQRFVKYAGVTTGDVIGGTLGKNTSGVLSVYLACALSMVMAFYVKGKLRKLSFLLLAVIMITPMTLNETKISFFLIPLALIAPAMIASNKSWEKFKKFFLYAGITFLALVIFVKVYDHFVVMYGQPSITKFIEKGGIVKYLYRGENEQDLSADTHVGRFDSIELTFKRMSNEGKLIAGVGAGNASPSFSPKMQGAYFVKFADVHPYATNISFILAEFGITGLVFNVLILAIIFFDSLKLRNAPGLAGPLSVSWACVTCIVGITFFYFSTVLQNIFVVLFWYFSGHIARMRYESGQ